MEQLKVQRYSMMSYILAELVAAWISYVHVSLMVKKRQTKLFRFLLRKG